MGIAHLRCGDCDSVIRSSVDITYRELVMAEVIELKTRQPSISRRPTLDDEMQGIISQLRDDALDLEIMFISYPGLAAKYAEKLDRQVGKLCKVMADIHTYNGN